MPGLKVMYFLRQCCPVRMQSEPVFLNFLVAELKGKERWGKLITIAYCIEPSIPRFIISTCNHP